ncbi:471_t:CDS:2, partial [Funneliformis caledonium]
FKEDVQIINIGTFSKSMEKPEEIALSFSKELFTEGVEFTNIFLFTKNREVTSTIPSVEKIKN